MVFLNSTAKATYYNYGQFTEITLSLKPCPFCSGEAKLSVNDWDSKVDLYKIICSRCGAGSPFWDHDPREAAKFWNRRDLYGDVDPEPVIDDDDD